MPLTVRLLYKSETRQVRLECIVHLARLSCRHSAPELLLDVASSLPQEILSFGEGFLSTNRASFAEELAESCTDSNADSQAADDNSRGRTRAQRGRAGNTRADPSSSCSADAAGASE